MSEPGQLFSARRRSEPNRFVLGPLVYVLPLWNPIRVAEEVALLDNLTEGRLECGFGAGIGPFSFAAYNIPWEQKREMTLEALHIIKGIWTHESFTFEGRYFKCKDIDSSIPLVQKPHPPLWMPTRSKDSIEEAASTGISTIQWVPAGMKAARQALLTNIAKCIRRAKPAGPKPHIGLMREIYVAESDRQARAEGEFHWKNFWERRGGARTYGAHGSTGLSTILDGSRRQELMDMEHSIAEGSFICGSPETVVGTNQENRHRSRRRYVSRRVYLRRTDSETSAQLAPALHRASHAGVKKVRDRRAEFSQSRRISTFSKNRVSPEDYRGATKASDNYYVFQPIVAARLLDSLSRS